ncbi:tetratricopeptide repeat protein [Paractinoplanes atraurantiacus]|uniref:Tfp pilus assembly protein PilF n=1 Tax=Paractinoplanes atraurantiacus TaxID=1036182 RepID=A0A285JMA1_9ACTN|nr:tetratricopeptide repeat protein [Actinoplanes atraurantiacus]SNY61388.1 Tfp pilus assembly protein PilF [Actinoplanes atraurantiacus]
MVGLDRDTLRWVRRGRLLVRTTVALLAVVGLFAVLAVLTDEQRRDGLGQFRAAGLALLQVAGILLLLLLVVGLIIWLSQPMGMAFENVTGDQQFDSVTLAQSIAGELQRIEAVHAAEARPQKHRSALPSVSLQPAVLSRREIMAPGVRAPLAPSGRADAVAAIGTIDVAGASLPVGSMLVAVKQLWPLPRSGAAVTGRLYRRDETLTLTVHVRRTRKSAPYEFTVTAPPGEAWQSFHQLVVEAASRLAYELSPADMGISSSGFHHLTRALGFYHDFQRIDDRAALQAAVSEAGEIPEGDNRQPDVRGLVYNLGVRCLQIGRLDQAERLLLRARRSDPSDAIICNAVGMLYFEQRRFADARETLQIATRLKPSELWDRLSRDEYAYAPWNQLGNTYVELADYAKAIEAYSRAVERPKAWAAPHSGLGNAYLQQHRWDDAEREYGAALAIDRASAHARCGLGNLEARRGRYQTAFDHYNEALRHDGQFAQAWNGLGEVHAALGRYTEAVAAHERAIELHPDDPYTLSSLGDTYRQQGELDRARETLESALRIDDSAAYVWRNLGELHLRRGAPAEAVQAFEEAVRRDPRDAVAWDGRARAARALDDGGEMERESLWQAAEENPMEPWGWNQLGDAYRRAHMHQESLHAHERALSRDPENSYALDGIGKALLALGELGLARKMHEVARGINPADAYASHGIANVLMARGDYAASIAANEEALRTSEHAAYARNGIGDAYERMRSYVDATRYFSETVERDGDDIAAVAYAYDGLARVALAQGRYPAALDALQKARDRQPRLAFPLITLGHIYLAQGTYDEAVEAYRQALVLEEARLDAWDGLGRAYVWQGDFATASETYRKAMTDHRDDGRLSLGAADVTLRRVVAGSEGGSLDEAVKGYDVAMGLAPASALVAQVRLAVIAAHREEPEVARQHAEAALRDFGTCWRLRPMPDFDLLELRALALLIAGDPGEAEAARAKAQANMPVGGRFDSVRVGVYDLLSDERVEGFAAFADLIPRGPELTERAPA